MSEILFADDDAAMRHMVAEVLGSAGHHVRLTDNGTTALAEVRRQPPDLIILDYRMGRPDGFAVCREIKSTPRLEHVPVLILTAESSTDDRLGGFDAGADDYLSKPFDARELLARVRALLRITERGRDRNPTSGLPGGEAIQREYAARAGRAEPVTLCYLDLDHFKPFGDRFGFAVADDAIRYAADALSSASGEQDFVGHIGGDDFILLCTRGHAREVVERAQRAFDERLAQRLPPEVARTGSFRAAGRDGMEREFPVTRLSAAIVHVCDDEHPGLAELGEEAALLKQEAKRLGAGGVVERDWPGGAR